MLQLKNITKTYGKEGTEQVQALKGIDLDFRENEFVSILGQSGSGKTTLLNIIGGLDHYTTGDLIINGKSTKDFKDRDWDTYRNHSIGFVFQSYNLISHQSILSNVELALTIAGMKKSERKEKAKKALEEVGLGQYIHKKPNELSGGQMQRVAIARALVGNPDILLADEPTGALDSATSIQIMDLLKEIAKDRLVIMVTHNPELAEKYSTRIIKVLDGTITDDSDPYYPSKTEIEKARQKSKIAKKTSMNFFTALNLSFNNLRTKKGRTILTAFAGSIGIIGIALILSLSNGVQEYISQVEMQTLAEYPLTIDSSTIDLGSIMGETRNSRMEAMTGNSNEEKAEDGKIESKDDITNSMTAKLQDAIIENNLKEFKVYLDSNGGNIRDYVSSIQYSYDLDFNIYSKDKNNEVIRVNPNPLKDDEDNEESQQQRLGGMSSPFGGMNQSSTSETIFEELLDSQELLNKQYSILSGRMPEKYNEMVIIVDENSRIPDSVLYALNIKDREEYKKIEEKIENGEDVTIDTVKYDYEDFVGLKYKIILGSDYYVKENGKWIDKSEDKNYMKELYENGIDVEIVGVLIADSDTVTATSGIVGYTHELTKHVIDKANESEIVKEQLEHKDKNILTDVSFDIDTYVDNMTDIEIRGYIQNLGTTNQMQMQSMMSSMSTEDLKEVIKSQLKAQNSTLEDNLLKFGYVDLETPASINIYPKDFEAKEGIEKIISDYNEQKSQNGEDEYVISYTDYVAIMISSITTIIDTISYVLIAFVAISLIVSSIMIAIITYISVLERTKEIGILRAIGASKRDVSRVFNAETIIEGLISGILGIGVTLLLCIPINIIVENLLGVSSIAALPVVGGIGLIILSIVLTVIAGIIPSSMASKRNPVEALRSE